MRKVNRMEITSQNGLSTKWTTYVDKFLFETTTWRIIVMFFHFHSLALTLNHRRFLKFLFAPAEPQDFRTGREVAY